MSPTPEPAVAAADPNRVRIFDTTLRDGEQSPGASMNLSEKLEVARALAALGVDIIEAGFPIASTGDFEAVRAIATEITGSVVCGLARCNDKDIDRAWEAVKYAQKARIHVFLATSAIHREHKLRMTRARSSRGLWPACAGQELLPRHRVLPRRRRAAPSSTSSARSSRRPSRRVRPPSIFPTPLAMPLPLSMRPYIRTLKERVPNIGKAIISTHCHDDLGLAVANTSQVSRSGHDRWNARSTVSASAPERRARGDRHGLENPPRLFRADHGNQDRAPATPSAEWSRRSPV